MRIRIWLPWKRAAVETFNKMLIEEKRWSNFFDSCFLSSGRGGSKCVGNVHYVSGTRVTEFDFLNEVFGQWMLICAELGVIQRKFKNNIGWLRMNLNELICHLRTNCTWQSLRQQGPRQDFLCVSVGQGVPLQEAAVVTLRLRVCWPLLSQRALQDPQLDHELTTQFTGQHLKI